MFGGFNVDCVDYCDDLCFSTSQKQEGEIANFTKPATARRWKHAMVDYLDTVFMFVATDNVCRHFLANLDLPTRSTILK